MKILAVDHNALHAASRLLYDRLALMPGMRLRLIVPDRWFDNYALLRWDTRHKTEQYDVAADHVLFPTRTHRLLYPSLGRQVREFQPDILFINAEPENFQTAQAASLLRASRQTRLVFTSWRNIDYRTIGFPYKFPLLNNWAERFVLARAAHGVVFNHEAQRIFASLGFPNTTVIPPYIDPSFTAQGTAAVAAEKTGGAFAIGYIGRLVEEKGIDLLLKAAAGLPFPYELFIIGSGPALESLQELAHELRIHENIHWTQAVHHADIPRHLARLDAVVLPSRTGLYWKEQFGRILIEAMASGVPVIGSSSGEIPHVIGDAGRVFAEGDVQSLREALFQFQNDSMTRSTYIARGKQRVRDHFSLQTAVERHFSLFEQILAS